MIYNDDWHIHSTHSCDGACMLVSDMITGAHEKGIERFGITDHIHTPYNYPDIDASRKEFDKNRTSGFYFGVEVSCVSEWELNKVKNGDYIGDITYGIRKGGPAGGKLAISLDEELINNYPIEFVVAGTHWAMYTDISADEIIKDYHRQNMFLAQHPLVDIVAHPWWYYGPCKDGWTEDFDIIPKSIHREFAHACIENDKLLEINIAANLLSVRYSEKFKSQYTEYLLYMKELGVKFSIGSDCHNEFYNLDMQAASDRLEKAGFCKSDFCSPI